MTGPDRATSDRDHIQRQMPPNARAVLFDCTGQYFSFTLLGPATDEILRPLTSHPACLSAGGRCELGLTTAWVSERVLGDLAGRQLLVTTDLAVSLFESLLESGARAGLRLAARLRGTRCGSRPVCRSGEGCFAGNDRH